MKDSFKIREITRADLETVRNDLSDIDVKAVAVEVPRKNSRRCELIFCVEYPGASMRDVVENLIAMHLVTYRSEYIHRSLMVSKIERWDDIYWDNFTVFLTDEADFGEKTLGVERQKDFGLIERTFNLGKLADMFLVKGLYSENILLARQQQELEPERVEYKELLYGKSGV